MKTRLLNFLGVIFFLFAGMTAMAEDFVTVYYHDGTHKMFFVSDIENITMSHLDVDSVTHNNFQSQIVETNYGTYIQMINQIDSVVFSHEDMAYPKTDDELETTSQLATVITERTNDIVDSLINLGNLNPVTVVNEFMKIPGVIDVTIDDDLHSVTMFRADSIYQHFIFNEEFDETIQQQTNLSHRIPKIVKNQKFIPKREISRSQKVLSFPLHENEEERNIKEIKSVLIIAPFENMNTSTGGYPNDIAQLCEDIKELLDVEPVYIHDEQAVISCFEGDKLDDYDLIIICTHGGGGSDKDYKMVDPKKVGVAFVSISTKADLKKLPDIRYASLRGNYNTYLCMTEKFLDNASFNGTVVFSYACSGFDRDYAEESMTEAFIDKNASSYFGSKVTVYNWLNENVTNNIVRSFCAGASLQDAISYWKNEDLCSPTHFYLSKLKLIDRDYPLGYYPEALELETRINVPIYAKSPYPNKLDYDIQNGTFSWDCQIQPFSYSLLHPEEFPNEHFPTYDVYVNGTKINDEDLTEMNFSWTPETNGTFNWYVIAKMKSKMGVNDYMTTFKSKEETFTIEDYPSISLFTNSVSLKVGETSTIDIIAGSGNYSIEEIKPTGVVTASISENHISIQALAAGTATITVKDDKSGETVPIEVTVEWDHLSFAITGNVDLKIGESTTIDIASGSGCYSIEEIKPTGVVTASISENHISIQAITGGTATITVKDDKSGETATFEVKVWDHLSFSMNGNIDMIVGENSTIDITSGSGSYSIEKIEPTGVVTASISENHISIEALAAGTAIITVKDDKSGDNASFEVTVQVKDIPAEAIDLGLPSRTLWASYNVGATKPEEYGGYYAWGEIKEKDIYYWTTYTHCDGVANSCHDIGTDISGTEFDVAHERWGDEWRMPTAEEFKELVYECDHQVTTQNGVYGFKFTGPNGNSIFFPAAGYRFNTGINKNGKSGEYWSSTVRDNKNYAYDTSMSPDYVYWDCYINRFAGLPVRPVKQSEPVLEDLVLSSTSPISLHAGETHAVKIISGNGIYSFENTNPRVATFTIEGNIVNISAIKAGTTTITVKDDKSGQTATIEVKVTGTGNDIPADVIDLGLSSGTKWASYNIGAYSPEDYGSYFAWGETETKESFTEDNYSANVDLTTAYITKISGTEHDAARIHWGENWRTPTILEIRELLRECSSEWVMVNSINGRRFTGPNGNSIFLPAAGASYSEGGDGRYWSSEQVWDTAKEAFYLYFSSQGTSGESRSPFYVGMPVRPVYSGSTDHLADFKLSSIDPVCLPIGESHIILITSGNDSYNILNSNESVATVSQGGWASIEQGTSGKTIVISAVATGTTIVTIFDNMSGQKISIAVKVFDPNSTIDIIGHEAVDLGLPSGTLWASNNIGAEKEEDYGDYYAWGETEPKEGYYSHTYTFCLDKNDENSCVYLGDIAGTEFDVAHVKWGGLWQMPTKKQVDELFENCESWVTEQNGVTGLWFKGPNGKSIFLPAAGFRANTNLYTQGNSFQYWTSTQVSSSPSTAYAYYALNLTNYNQSRYLGLTVRPVANSSSKLVNLTLSEDNLRLNVGETASIEIKSGNGHYSVTSSDANVATAKLQNWHSIENGTSGTSVVIDALSLGEVAIFVTDNDCGQTRRIEIKVSNIDLNGHEVVDLGLTSGTLWATCNVGAASPEEFGGYYAWGETEEKESYSWGTYTHCDGSYSTCHDIGEDISGTEYDVAHVKWGGSWKMPSYTQVEELLDECSSEWTTLNDVKGYRFTGPNGKSIFIPAAGYHANARHYSSGKAGVCWLSSKDKNPNYYSDILIFDKNDVETTTYERYYGFTIRPIVE